MSFPPGRWCALNGVPEVSDLKVGMDFRLPQHRREVFLRFWEFHLKYRSHPGLVYMLLPYLAETFGWSTEEKLWFAYINGNTQNPVTSWLIFKAFPSLLNLDTLKLERWFATNYKRLEFDTDRRYFKKSFIKCVSNYQDLTLGHQAAFFNQFAAGPDERVNFRAMWEVVSKHFVYFGRLSTFSYLEYLRIMGLSIDCDQLFLYEMEGSKSHRNGLCKVLGRDDLDWHDSNPSFDGRYTAAHLEWLVSEGEQLRDEARARFAGRDFERDVGYFTMESALCTYKSWHRPNRRYPNVYSDMLVGRIRKAEQAWSEVHFRVFWEARQRLLPKALRLEDNPADCGVAPTKQNFYRERGCPVMMDVDWPCFKNAFNDEVRHAQGEV